MVDCAHESLTNGLLATLTAHLIQLNEDVLGIRSSGPKKMAKLPMKLFHDYKIGGSVYIMLWIYFQEKATFRYFPLVPHEARHLLMLFRDALVVRDYFLIVCGVGCDSGG